MVLFGRVLSDMEYLAHIELNKMIDRSLICLLGFEIKNLVDDDKQYQPGSIDLTIGRVFENNGVRTGNEIDTKDGFVLEPDKTYLVEANEWVRIPKVCLSHFEERSSLGRIGIKSDVENTEDLYSGCKPRFLMRAIDKPVKLYPDQRFVQMLFEYVPAFSNILKFCKNELKGTIFEEMSEEYDEYKSLEPEEAIENDFIEISEGFDSDERLFYFHLAESVLKIRDDIECIDSLDFDMDEVYEETELPAVIDNFSLGRTEEKVKLSDRCGLYLFKRPPEGKCANDIPIVKVYPGWVDQGYEGNLTYTLHVPYRVVIEPGLRMPAKPCRTGKTRRIYGDRTLGSKYQGTDGFEVKPL